MKNDDAYANAAYIPGAAEILEGWHIDARQHREMEAAVGRARLNTSYGPHEREAFDLFYPAGRPEGLVVFVHGGFWRMLGREAFSHLATGATSRGLAAAIPSYVLTPEARISEITRQIAASITKAAEFVAGPIYLTGHSAGGHLVARMCNPDVPLAEAVRARISAVLPISPLSDLRPLIETSMNADFQLDLPSAEAESPVLQPKCLDVPVRVWVGADERPAFIDQARWLAEAWPDCTCQVEPGRHHFDVIDALRDPDSPMMDALLG